MTFDDAMTRLEAAGSEQTRRTYRRHGVPEPLFGVSCATQKALKKAIGVDPELAKALWATGNYDARVLATMVADSRAMSDEDLDGWLSDVACYGLADAVASMVATWGRTRALADRYRDSEREYPCCFGWQMVGRLAEEAGGTGVDYFMDRLAEIERRIHGEPNRVRYSMNMTIIRIGLRDEALREAALATAARVGTVEVDHGDTSCRTPDASSYIEKTLSYRENRIRKS